MTYENTWNHKKGFAKQLTCHMLLVRIDTHFLTVYNVLQNVAKQ
jgi:hypothetical protein